MEHHQHLSFCQSCAMPMAKPDDYGTNLDGSQSKEYCHYCYQNGQFTEPDITVELMMTKCECIMKQIDIPNEQIEHTKALIPLLKRWRE